MRRFYSVSRIASRLKLAAAGIMKRVDETEEES